MGFRKGFSQAPLNFSIDFVICLDATGNMRDTLEKFKKNLPRLYPSVAESMKSTGRCIEELRVKLIAFRDYKYDEDPMRISPFYVLGGDNDESEQLYAFAESIEATGGADAAKNALEAIALAFKSDWTKTGAGRRHIIMVYTDAPALELGARAGCPGYPTDLPKNLAELHELWEGQDMEPRAKRLLMFAPDTDPWIELITWAQAFLLDCTPEFTEYDFKFLLPSIMFN